MTYGDINPGGVVDLKFTTVGTDGAPTQLAGGPAVSVYKDNGDTESTAGVTLTADFDGRTGLNHVRITTVTDGTFYSAGSNFQVVITTGTVGGTSVVGYLVGEFSIQARSAATPAEVNAEVVDALNVDTYTEPGQEVPGVTISLAKKIGYLYKFARNRITVDSSGNIKIYADDTTTVDQKTTASDDETTLDRAEIGSGP